jgi:hypothetical protein
MLVRMSSSTRPLSTTIPVTSWSRFQLHPLTLLLCHLLIILDPGATVGVNFFDTKLNIMSLLWNYLFCFSRFAKACQVPLALTLQHLPE